MRYFTLVFLIIVLFIHIPGKQTNKTLIVDLQAELDKIAAILSEI